MIVVLITIELRIFQIWSDALKSSLFLKISFYSLLISNSIMILGMVFRTILWVRYKPITLDQREKIDWPFVSIMMMKSEKIQGGVIDISRKDSIKLKVLFLTLPTVKIHWI
jgi:hypothetical protein